MGYRNNDQPFHITTIRQLPCEDVDAVFNAAIGRVLNARSAVPIQPEPDECDQVGEPDG